MDTVPRTSTDTPLHDHMPGRHRLAKAGQDGVTEAESGTAKRSLASADGIFFPATPALEIGGDFAPTETSVGGTRRF